MRPLPLTVIGGYLGAGKTTLINRLLAEDHGARLMVMVNDFGAVNVDAALLASATEDTLELTNGCICCSIGSALFEAIGMAIDRRPRPDHLVIEASGIADPAKIADLARAEPELAYGGIVTVADGEDFARLAADARIGPQVRGQVSAADVTLVSKVDVIGPGLAVALAGAGGAGAVALSDLGSVAPLVLDPGHGQEGPRPFTPHPAYLRWQGEGEITGDRVAGRAYFAARPQGLYRLKGVIGSETGPIEVQCVGSRVAVKASDAALTGLVGIGLATGVSLEEIEAWWSGRRVNRGSR